MEVFLRTIEGISRPNIKNNLIIPFNKLYKSNLLIEGSKKNPDYFLIQIFRELRFYKISLYCLKIFGKLVLYSYVSALPCVEITSPLNGKVTCSGHVTNGVCKFDCDEGYNLIGSRERTCTHTSTWSGEKTICKGKCVKSRGILKL